MRSLELSDSDYDILIRWISLRCSGKTRQSSLKAQNLELYREEQIKRIESLLMEAGDSARKIGVTMEELHELLDLVNGGE